MRRKTHAVFRILLPALWCLGELWSSPVPASEPLGQEIPIPAPPGSRQHHIAATADQGLILSWVEGGNSDARVRFALRRDGRWSEPHTIAAERRSLAAAPVVIGLSDGALAAAWMTHIDKAKDRYAAEIHLSRSADGGKSWNRARHPYGSKARIYDAQMSLAALADGRSLLLWTDTRNQKSADRYRLMAAQIDRNGSPGPELTVDDDVCSCCETGLSGQGKEWLAVYRDHLAGEVRDTALARWQDGKLSRLSVHEDHWVIAGCPSNGPAVDWRGSRAVVVWFTVADGVGRVKLAFSPDGGKSLGPPVEVDSNANGYVNTLLLEDGTALVAWRGRAGPEEELRLARVHPEGTVEAPITLYRGAFPPWPNRHIGLARAGNEIYLAWSDASGPKIRLTSVPVALAAGQTPSAPEADGQARPKGPMARNGAP